MTDRPHAYDYVKRMYDVHPQVGQRIRHSVTKREGLVAEARWPEHYIHVRFDGSSDVLPCHPLELEFIPDPPLDLIDCPRCGGSGFTGPETGYGGVCGECGGLKQVPRSAGPCLRG